jgi:hypothetical protein
VATCLGVSGRRAGPGGRGLRQRTGWRARAAGCGPAAAGLLWSLHPAPGTSQATGFSPPAAGFTVRLQVLTGGSVRASATLRRLLPVTVSVQTVRRDGLAGLLYTSAATCTTPAPGTTTSASPPYFAFFTGEELGGSVQANALATEQFWSCMIIFLNNLAARQPRPSLSSDPTPGGQIGPVAEPPDARHTARSRPVAQQLDPLLYFSVVRASKRPVTRSQLAGELVV